MVLAEQIKEIEQRREALERCLALSYKKTDFFNTLVSPTVRLSGIFVCCTINRT